MEAVSSPETIPEDSHLHTRRRENLRSHDILENCTLQTGTGLCLHPLANGGLPGCDVMWIFVWVPTFRMNILPPSSGLKPSRTHLQVHMTSQPTILPCTSSPENLRSRVCNHFSLYSKSHVTYLKLWIYLSWLYCRVIKMPFQVMAGSARRPLKARSLLFDLDLCYLLQCKQTLWFK
jgi:hypothetical protein